MSAPRIVIAAGGTAGHVVPAIAVADALRAEGAEVSFVGGERAEAELVPAAGYPLDPIRVEGISRRNPLKAARAARARRRSRCARRARSCAVAARTRCSAAAGTSPGRSGWRRCCGGIPLVLTEADSHLGLTQPAARPRARGASASRSRSPGRDGERYLRHRTARAAARRPTAPAARAAFGIGEATSAACSCSAARSAPARSTTRPWPHSPTRPTACCTSPAGATSPTSGRPARTTTCATT